MHQRSALRAMVVLLFLSSGAMAQTLNGAVEQALNTSPDLLNISAKRRATDDALRGAKGGYRPKVDLITGIGRQHYTSPAIRALGTADTMTKGVGTLTLSQMLFDGMLTPSEVARQKARVSSAAFEVANQSEQTALDTIDAYLNVLRNQELVQLANENVEVHQKAFDQIKLRSEGGFGRKSDEDQMSARLALAKANLLAAEGNLKEAEFAYYRQLGEMPKDLSKPETPNDSFLPADFETAMTNAKQSNPLIKSAMADRDAAKAQHEAAKSFLYPRLDLEGNLTENHNVDGVRGKVEDAQVMLMLRWNLMNGGKDGARSDETAKQIVEADEIRRRTEREVEQNALLSYNAYQTANGRLPSLEEHVKSGQETRDAYAKQFTLGQRTLLDLLDSENEYFTARNDHVNGLYTALFARYRIAADAGQLLTMLGITPPTEAKQLEIANN
ncbi:TolC family outer membrane protein [Chitinibacteraceae bacterium HSL-7]